MTYETARGAFVFADTLRDNWLWTRYWRFVFETVLMELVYGDSKAKRSRGKMAAIWL
jgi:hypothetical protein